MRRVPGETHLADHLTKGKTWRELDASVRCVGGRMKVIKSSTYMVTKGIGWKGRSGFTVYSEVQRCAREQSNTLQYRFDEVSGARGKSDAASEW